MSRRGTLLVVAVLASACTRTPDEPPAGGGGQTSQPSAGGDSAVGDSESGGSGGVALTEPKPRYHPPPGFESCVHAEVTADCADGWCKLPPSCFVMGSPESEWRRGRDTEAQVAVTLTHWVEIQQQELSRAEWTAATGTPVPGPENCTEPECPVAMVSWWDALHVANLLSDEKGLARCYEPVGCTGALGVDLECTGVADPDASVYECEGYRLPTRAEAEYAARAGTISTFYSGDITPYEDVTACEQDPALELIGWYCGNSGGVAHPGGGLQANGFGLQDMIGNLGEWSNEEQRFASSPGGSDPNGTVGTRSERLRFSPQYDDKSYIARPASLMSASRNGRGPRIGFRLIRTLPD